MIKPFHLSFVVPDLKAAKEFYHEVLGCDIGRDNGSWIDILFFGHQITMHQSTENMPARSIDHFGPVLDKKEWLEIADKCSTNKIGFEMNPTIKEEGSSLEVGKYIIRDPAGNILEFKFYGSFSETMAGQNV